MQMLSHLWTAHHDHVIIVVVLLLAIILSGRGKDLARSIKGFFGKGDVNVNITEPPAPLIGKDGKPLAIMECMVNPLKCVAHKEERGRSLRNMEDIKANKTEVDAKMIRLWDHYTAFEKEVRLTLLEIKKENHASTNRILMSLVASGTIKPEHIPEEKI